MTRRVLSLSWSLAFVALGSSVGCNSGAVATQECREIEYARCDASVACGTIDDAAACRRFYSTHCLHGIAGPEKPTADEQARCVGAIETAGKCAEKDDSTPLAECKGLRTQLVAGADRMKDVCDVVGRPWDLLACDYLNREPDDGSGGEGGSE